MEEQTTNQQPIPQNSAPHNELESIKNEIKEKMTSGNKNLPWNSIVVTVVLGVLTLFSVGQMVGSVYVFNKLNSGNIGPASTAPAANSPQDAPDMVGGC